MVKLLVESVYLCIMEYPSPQAYPGGDLWEWVILGSKYFKTKSLQKYVYF